jgi:sialic acid synthase SpsE
VKDFAVILEAYKKLGVFSIAKIAHSARNNLELIDFAQNNFDKIYITKDIMDNFEKKDKTVYLYCYSINGVPVYPVMIPILFNGVFPKFNGFSDHSISSLNSICSITHGATVIERHICLNNDQAVPDARFALNPEKAKRFVQCIRKDYLEKQIRFIEECGIYEPLF